MAQHRDDEVDDDNEQINQQNRNQANHGAQNADANQNALPDWLNVLMGRPRDISNAIRAQRQRDATTKLFEHYYGRKASDLNLTNERATKRERELLFQREGEMPGLELNKEGVYPSTGEDDAEDDIETAQRAVLIQRACIAASTALIQGDFPATQRFILTCHHVARVIASDASQRRDVKLVADEFKPLIGKKGSVLNALSKQSKDQINELNISIKLIASKSPTPQVQLTQPYALQIIQSSIQQQPLSQQQQQQQITPTPQYQFLNYYNNHSRFNRSNKQSWRSTQFQQNQDQQFNNNNFGFRRNRAFPLNNSFQQQQSQQFQNLFPYQQQPLSQTPQFFSQYRMMMQQLPFASKTMSQPFSQTMPQTGLIQPQSLWSSNLNGASQQTTVPKQALLTLGKEREEHDSQQMEKDSDDDADSESE